MGPDSTFLCNKDASRVALRPNKMPVRFFHFHRKITVKTMCEHGRNSRINQLADLIVVGILVERVCISDRGSVTVAVDESCTKRFGLLWRSQHLKHGRRLRLYS